MIDEHYRDPRLTALYDAVCAGRPDFAFYLPLVMSAGSVLDVGCGTGELLRLARAAGHAGRLRGLDPAAAMLDHARECRTVRWTLGSLTSLRLSERYELVVMTGHAFQVLLSDDAIAETLSCVRSLLDDGGRFAFETRNPLFREWEQWVPEDVAIVRSDRGPPVEVTRRVDDVSGDLVTFSMKFTSLAWERPLTTTSTLRFIGVDALNRHLGDCTWNRDVARRDERLDVDRGRHVSSHRVRG